MYLSIYLSRYLFEGRARVLDNGLNVSLREQIGEHWHSASTIGDKCDLAIYLGEGLGNAR